MGVAEQWPAERSRRLTVLREVVSHEPGRSTKHRQGATRKKKLQLLLTTSPPAITDVLALTLQVNVGRAVKLCRWRPPQTTPEPHAVAGFGPHSSDVGVVRLPLHGFSVPG